MISEITKSRKLILVWQDNRDKKRYKIGEVEKKADGYTFEYDKIGIKSAIEKGFGSLIAFPDTNKKYESKNLFAVFSTRLPDKKRSDIKNILEKYNLDEYDEFELLRVTEGKLPTDNIEFIDEVNFENVN